MKVYADMDPVMKNERNLVHLKKNSDAGEAFRNCKTALKWERKKI